MPSMPSDSALDDVEAFVTALFSGGSVEELSYDDLRRIARKWIDYVSEINQEQVKDEAERSIDRIGQLLSKRKLAAFRGKVRPKSQLAKAYVELFILSRIRPYVLAYLSVQEGENFEGADMYDTMAPDFIRQFLRFVGKRSYSTSSFGLARIRMRLKIDPLLNLREIYSCTVCDEQRRGLYRCGRWLFLQYHKCQFKLKTFLLGRIVWAYTRSLSRGKPADFRAFMRRRGVQRSSAIAILVLFPSARALSEREWLLLFRRVEEYFVPRLCRLVEIIPEESIRNHGLIKLIKVGFGTIAGRTSVRNLHESCNVDFIFNTLRLAYCWGLSYPLVDNFLDSDSTSEDARRELMESLAAILLQRSDLGVVSGSDKAVHPCVAEMTERLSEAISLTPLDQRTPTLRMLHHLLEAHRHDASRRLSTTNSNCDREFWMDVMVDTALKSALVRSATMKLCGIAIDGRTAARLLIRSLFNQLGDDLWDIYEDFNDDRITPFTVYLTHNGLPNPFKYYLDYSTLLSCGMSRRRKTAIFMGFCETLRDCLLELNKNPADTLGVSSSLDHLIGQRSSDLRETIRDVPHVDFDAVLFSFESAILGGARPCK